MLLSQSRSFYYNKLFTASKLYTFKKYVLKKRFSAGFLTFLSFHCLPTLIWIWFVTFLLLNCSRFQHFWSFYMLAYFGEKYFKEKYFKVRNHCLFLKVLVILSMKSCQSLISMITFLLNTLWLNALIFPTQNTGF